MSRAVGGTSYHDGRYGYLESGHLGWYRQGVFVERRLIFLKPDVLVVADEFYSSAPHTYRQFFHWGETGTLRLEGGVAHWEGRNCTAQLHQISTAPIAASLRAGRISRHYNQAQENAVLETVIQGQGFTSVFSVLVLDRREARESVEVEELPVSSRSSGVRFGHDLIEALRVRKGGRSWVLAVAHQEYACPADIFQAGGCHGFGSVVVFDEAAGEKEIGTILAR